MKRIFVFISLIFCVSCLPDSEVYESINPSVFPKTEDDAISLLATSYIPVTVQGFYSSDVSGLISTTELITDIGNCQWTAYWLNLLDLQMFPFVTEYTKFYGKLNHISLLTQNIDLIAGLEISEERKKLFIAELQCLRGWINYILYDLYGPIPIIPLEVIEKPLEQVRIKRASTEEMVSYIEADLLAAISNLPYVAEEYGRATKGLANMVLLKLYMHEKKWDKAENIARELCKEEYGYELMNDYSSIFTLENERNKEIIFASSCDRTIGHSWYAHVLPIDYPGENPNYTKWGGYRIDWDFYNTFEEFDDRKKMICAEYVSASDGITYNQENKGSQLTKGAVPLKYGDDMQCTGTVMQTDWIIFRFADVKLMLAEAIVKKNNVVTQEAIDLVNEIRIRAKLSPLVLSDYLNVDKFNEMLLMERGHELWYEGHRRSDLIRFGKYVEYMRKKENGRLIVDEHNILFPIPQSAINEGKGVLIQNPGY